MNQKNVLPWIEGGDVQAELDFCQALAEQMYEEMLAKLPGLGVPEGQYPGVCVSTADKLFKYAKARRGDVADWEGGASTYSPYGW